MDFARLSRALILWLARSPRVRGAVERYGLQLGASRFVAGLSAEEALEVVRGLNAEGLLCTLDHLGEHVTDPVAARGAAEAYVDLLDRIAAAGVRSTVSLKLSQLGLKLDPGLARDLLRRIVAHAARLGNFVRIDMEESALVDATLGLYEQLRAEGFDNLGVVIQAYLYRSRADLERLSRLGANVRLVKGAYAEPPDVAFPRKRDVDRNFLELIAFYLSTGNYTAVATHDTRAIEFTRRFVEQQGIPRDRFEFQMLYGIRPALQRQLAREGYRVRVYVPFGRDWYPYFMRRLAERPANVAFLLRNLIRR